MIDGTTAIGLAAAFFTTICDIPQLKKCCETGEADDLSLKMLLILCSGVGFWIAYGVLKDDWVIVGANIVSIALIFGLLYFKLRGNKAPRSF